MGGSPAVSLTAETAVLRSGEPSAGARGEKGEKGTLFFYRLRLWVGGFPTVALTAETAVLRSGGLSTADAPGGCGTPSSSNADGTHAFPWGEYLRLGSRLEGRGFPG